MDRSQTEVARPRKRFDLALPRELEHSKAVSPKRFFRSLWQLHGFAVHLLSLILLLFRAMFLECAAETSLYRHRVDQPLFPGCCLYISEARRQGSTSGKPLPRSWPPNPKISAAPVRSQPPSGSTLAAPVD